MATHSRILGNLMGYSQWGCKELDTIARLTFSQQGRTHTQGSLSRREEKWVLLGTKTLP